MTTDSNALASSAGLKAALGYYRLVAKIGRGGMADVFLALFPNGDGTSRQVVLKQLQSELAVEADFRAMFENEAFLATRFHHENVVETYDLYSDRDLCVLVMEFLDGQTLSRIRQRARRGSQVPFSIHLRVLAEALAGLHYVHELRDEEGKPLEIVHRDVTPSNIFATYDGRVKVVDFGIAKATCRPADETRMGVVKGKLAYMSPEAVRGEGVDRRSDIFSVGVILWEAATGRRLWQELDEVAVFRRLATGDLPIQVPGAEGTSADMLRIAERALAVDPRQRYATAEEMRRELEVLLARLGKTAQPALAGYMEAFFSVEREKFQAVVDEALARFPSQPIAQSRLLRNEVSASYPGVDPTEPPTTISPAATSGGTFRTTTTTLDVAEDSSEIPNFRPGVRRALGVAFVAAAAAIGVAYAAHAPIGAPAPAAAKPVSVEPAAIYEEEPSRLNRAAPEPPRAPEVPLATRGSAPAPTPARGTIAAVFLARPAQARLFLDGVPLEGNPAGIRRQPDDKPHLLRVEAPGYATLVRVIDLDRDVAKELELAPDATHALVAPRAASSTEPRPAKRAVRDDPWGI